MGTGVARPVTSSTAFPSVPMAETWNWLICPQLEGREHSTQRHVVQDKEWGSVSGTHRFFTLALDLREGWSCRPVQSETLKVMKSLPPSVTASWRHVHGRAEEGSGGDGQKREAFLYFKNNIPMHDMHPSPKHMEHLQKQGLLYEYMGFPFIF